MAYYEMMPAGLPAGLQSGMDSVLNKKFGTATSYAPGTWPDTVNLMGPLPEKTIVSSPIADFSDGADDVPTKSLVVTIPPTLSGVSSVSETQTGRNLVNGISSYTVLANATAQTLIGSCEMLANIAYTLSCSMTGTPTARTRNRWAVAKSSNMWDGTAVFGNDFYTAPMQTFTPSESGTYYFFIWSQGIDVDVSYDNFMCELGSTAHAYEPYQTPTQYTASLGRAVYGGTADIVNGAGKEQYQKVKISDLTWQKQTVSGRDFFIATINDQETTNTHDVAIDIAGLSYAGMVTVAGMSDKSLAKWLQSVRIYDTSVSSVSDLLSAYGNGKIVFYLKDTLQTDFTFDGQEVPTRPGYNAFWSDEGDTEVTYRADINLALGGN